MDYSLAALKLFCGQLKHALHAPAATPPPPSSSAISPSSSSSTAAAASTLFGILFQRAWLQVHKIVDLSPYPDREAIWHLEVIEAYKLFYQSSPED